MKINTEINLGNLIELGVFLFALWRFHIKKIERLVKIETDLATLMAWYGTWMGQKFQPQVKRGKEF